MKEENQESLMEKIVSLAKRRGFVFQGSEIYGGLAGTWDYGPRGVQLKNNIKNLWWRTFVESRDDMYGLDAAILMNERVWEASGHTGAGFTDPLAECQNCRTPFRVDNIPGFSENTFQSVREEHEIKFNDWALDINKNLSNKIKSIDEIQNKTNSILNLIETEDLSVEQSKGLIDLAKKLIAKADKEIKEGQTGVKIKESLEEIIQESKVLTGIITSTYLNRYLKCPNCSKGNSWEVPKAFNLMFETKVGAEGDQKSYLRPETAQGIFVNFKNIVDSMNPKLPFGIGQIGKAFRNEIAPRDFIFRSREFEQMEIEYFVQENDWEIEFNMWLGKMHEWMEMIGLDKSKIHKLEVLEEDRAHYSKKTIDFEYDYPFGKKELYGLAYRTNFDLENHTKHSGESLSYFDDETKERIIPHVIEPTFGIDRTILAVLCEAYTEDELGGEPRTYLAFKPSIAPVKAAVFPLLKNKPELVEKAREVYGALKKRVPQVMFDDNGNVGKRYRRQDEIGTPFCITVDFDTLGENPELKDTVTLRDRDTGEQVRLSIEEAIEKIESASVLG